MKKVLFTTFLALCLPLCVWSQEYNDPDYYEATSKGNGVVHVKVLIHYHAADWKQSALKYNHPESCDDDKPTLFVVPSCYARHSRTNELAYLQS